MGRVDLGFGAGLDFDRSDDAGRIDTEQVKVAKPRCHVDVGCVSILHGARREEPWRSLTYLCYVTYEVGFPIIIICCIIILGNDEGKGRGRGGGVG
jgi:hypothetical protein